MSKEKIRLLHEGGATPPEIAAATGCSLQYTHRVLQKMGVKGNKRIATHCRFGHSFADVGQTNTGQCKACVLENQRNWYARRKATIEELTTENKILSARVAELEGERAWRPIATAPKDGTVIQAWIPANPTWGDLAKPVYAWFVGDNDPYLEFVNEWVTADARQRSRGSPRQAIYPTHWQPLPGGPEVERG